MRLLRGELGSAAEYFWCLNYAPATPWFHTHSSITGLTQSRNVEKTDGKIKNKSHSGCQAARPDQWRLDPQEFPVQRIFVVLEKTREFNGFHSADREQKFSSCLCLFVIAVTRQRAHYNSAQLTTQPLESNFRSDMQRKLRLQPPLSFVQSLTGPKESRRTSRESKEELIISSSLAKEQVTKESQFHSWGSFWAFGPAKVRAGGLFTQELHKVKIYRVSQRPCERYRSNLLMQQEKNQCADCCPDRQPEKRLAAKQDVCVWFMATKQPDHINIHLNIHPCDGPSVSPRTETSLTRNCLWGQPPSLACEANMSRSRGHQHFTCFRAGEVH